MVTLAVGDVHGMKSQLVELLATVRDRLENLHPGETTTFVFLGDYVDRGPDSAGVVSIVRELQQEGSICLRGNHEQLMIDSVRSDDDFLTFIANGGDKTLRSFRTIEAFEAARRWMETLPTCFEDELRYFVHAGVDPAVPLSEQTDLDRLWIRKPFLAYEGAFEKYIVHGHTPTTRLNPPCGGPDVRANRCNLDTGAVYGGSLSAAVFNETQPEPLYTTSIPLSSISK